MEDREIAPGRAAPKRAVLLLFFMLSGASSLIYQVVWQRLLGLHYGVGSISTAIVVSVFMLGLGLGSLLAGRFGPDGSASIRAYFYVEFGIGIFGVASLPLLGWLADMSGGSGYASVALFSFLFLLIPTALMGATLPIALAALRSAGAAPMTDIASYYFVNTLGAGIGCIVTSFLLVSLLGLDGSIYFAAFLNGILAISLFVLARGGPTSGQSSAEAVPEAKRQLSVPILYGAALVGGFIAIGYQVVWFRLLGILLKDSIYSFSILLGVYLIAIAIGSAALQWLSARARSRTDLYLVLNGAIGLLAGCAILLLYQAGDSLIPGLLDVVRRQMIIPIPPADAASLIKSALSLAAAFAFTIFVIAAPSFCMGASFPLLASLAADGRRNPPAAVARIYFAVIAGNVAGGLLTGFLLLPWLGSERTISFFMALSLLFLLLRARNAELSPLIRAAPVAAALLLILAFPGRGELIRFLHDLSQGGTVRAEEGVEGSVVVQRHEEALRLFINGSEHGGRPNPLFHLEAATTLSQVDLPRDVLVIGLGTGSLLEGVLRDPLVERVTLVEINGTVLRALARDEELGAILGHPKVRIVHDDARRWLQRTDLRFDAILMDPVRSGTAFSNNIYSEEFFRMQSRHLNPAGVVMVWTDEFAILPNTLARIYPHVDLHCRAFMVASRSPAGLRLRPDRLRSILAGFDPEQRKALLDSDCAQARHVARVRYRPSTLTNRDHRPKTEYYLGLAIGRLLGGGQPADARHHAGPAPSLADLATD